VVAASAVQGSGSAADPIAHFSLQGNALINGGVISAAGAITTPATSATAVRIRVSATNARAADALSVTSTGGVKVLASLTDADGKAQTTAAGSTTLAATNFVNGALEFFAFTTSTTAGSVTISSNGASQVVHVVSRVGSAYNVTAVFPTTITEGGSANVFAKITDVFGNPITVGNSNHVTRASGTTAVFNAAHNGTLKLSALGATPTTDAYRWNAAQTAWQTNVTGAKAGTIAMTVELPDATDLEVGFAKPNSIVFASISSTNTTAQIAALTAQVAALQAQLANSRAKSTSVTKKKYNTLARKWNAANPGARVALKK